MTHCCGRDGFGVSLGFVDDRSQSVLGRLRTFAGVFCLLAVCLMQAPLVLAAWSMSTGMCCAGSYCPIAAHHHKKIASEAAHEMDCGHEMSSMAGCKMSCCHDTDQPTITANVFVMPPVTSVAGQVAVVAAVEAPKQTEFLRSIEPISPPPRTLSSTL
jgi:hypothetical protein